MKLILKEGRFLNNDGKDILHFEPGLLDVEKLFTKSIDKVMHIFIAYDFGKIENKDIYYIYPTLKNCASNKEIQTELKKLLSGDDSNILNIEYTTICMPIEEKINTIFWDVLNDIIIVFGKENFKKLLFKIELSRIPKILQFKTTEDQIAYLEQTSSPVYRKTKNI